MICLGPSLLNPLNPTLIFHMLPLPILFPLATHSSLPDFPTGVKGMLDKVGGEVIGFTKMFPLEPALVNFTKFLTDSQKNIEAYYPQIDQLDFYRYQMLSVKSWAPSIRITDQLKEKSSVNQVIQLFVFVSCMCVWLSEGRRIKEFGAR